ncbi:MAG: galactokinase [Acidobacteriota bacterium]|nr:galactokinase [Acidobacteriota bacterium]
MSQALGDRAVDAFVAHYGRRPDVLIRAPGRVNLLGGHVDYHDGFVLPGAIDRSIWLAAAAAGDKLRAWSLTLDEEHRGCVVPPPGPPGTEGRSRTNWLEYPLGVAWALAASGREVTGLDALVASDLPVGAGVSSSAALEVAFLLAWQAICGFELDRVQAARLGQIVENDYLDVQSGIMDQFASLHGEVGRVMILDCRHLSWELLPVPAGAGVLVVDTGVRRRLVEGGLNDRRGEGMEALDLLRAEWPELDALRDLSPDRLSAAELLLEPRLFRRVRHVVTECARVHTGAEVLRGNGGLPRLGELIDQSHRSSRDDYEVSVEELDALCEAASGCEACYGARLSGAGFGGCMTALIDDARVGEVLEALERSYRDRFGLAPDFLHCRVSAGAERVF